MKKMSSSTIDLLKYKMMIVGMVNILVLSFMLGIQGAGYLGISLAFLAVLVSFHSLWLSSTVTKYVRGRNARNQYKNSRQFLKGALIYVIITSIVLCAVLVLFSDRLGSFLIRDIHISICIVVVAALLPVWGISEALSGYLQGMGYHLPVKVFLLVRQAVAFAGSIAGMKILNVYGEKVAKLKHNDAVTGVYSAFGSLLGILVGCIAGLSLLLVFCFMVHGEIRDLRSKDNARYQENMFYGFRVLLSKSAVQGSRYVMLLSPLFLNYILYIRLCKNDGDSALWIKTGGFLFGEAVPILVILVLCFVILNYKNYRQLAAHWKNEAYSPFREKAASMLLGVFVLALPVCGAVAVMAEPVLKCLAKGVSKDGTGIIMYAAIGAVLLILETIIFKLMEIWSETLYSYLIVIVSFGVQTAFAVMACKGLELNVNGILLGMILQAALIAVFFFVKFSGRLKISGNRLKKFVMAVIIALTGVLIMLLIYQAAGKKLAPGIALAVCMIPGFLLYLAVMTVLRIVSSKEAEYMPGGELFLWLNGIIDRIK